MDILEALDKYTDARMAYIRKFTEMQDSTWGIGYYMFEESQALNKAKLDFNEALDDYVSRKIQEYLMNG